MSKIDLTKFDYLGDGVYAFWDGDGVSIRVNHHDNEEAVYLEPFVIEALNKFVAYQRERERKPHRLETK